MEKFEKRIARKLFYAHLIDRMGEGSYTTREIYDLITEVDKKVYGPSYSRSAGNYHKVVSFLENTLLPDWMEVVKDTEARAYGKGNPRIFSLIVRKDKGIPEIKALVLNSLDNKSGAVTTLAVKAEERRKERKKHLPKKEFINKMANLLVKIERQGGSSIGYAELSKMVKGVVNQNVVLGWSQGLSRIGVNLDIIISDGQGTGRKGVLFKNLRGTLLTLASKYEETYGTSIGLDIEKELSISNSKVVKKLKPETVVESAERSSTIFAVGGLISRNEKPMEVDDLCKNLNTHYGMCGITKVELLKTIAGEPELEVLRNGNLIGLTQNRKSWEVICSNHGPEHPKFEKKVVARLGLSEEQLKSLGINATTLSVISEVDRIYEIKYFLSARSIRSLVRLFRTFRGTDALFDTELVTRLNDEMILADARSSRADVALSIESMID